LGLVVTGLVLLCACGGPSAVRHASPACPPDELAEAVGLLSTILGFGKDALARTYVSLASHRRVPSLDLSALFSGVDA